MFGDIVTLKILENGANFTNLTGNSRKNMISICIILRKNYEEKIEKKY